MTDINAVLAQRGRQYGAFEDHAAVTQALKLVAAGNVTITTSNGDDFFVPSTNYKRLAPFQAEAIDMTMHKYGRILNGNPDYIDSWTDVVGYNKLVENILIKQQDTEGLL